MNWQNREPCLYHTFRRDFYLVREVEIAREGNIESEALSLYDYTWKLLVQGFGS